LFVKTHLKVGPVSVTCGMIECMFERKRMSDPEVIARFDELMERCYPAGPAAESIPGIATNLPPREKSTDERAGHRAALATDAPANGADK